MNTMMILSLMAMSSAPEAPVAKQETGAIVDQGQVQISFKYIDMVESAYQRCIDDRVNLYINAASRSSKVINNDIYINHPGEKMILQIAEDIVQTTVNLSTKSKVVGMSENGIDAAKEDKDEILKKDLVRCADQRSKALAILGRLETDRQIVTYQK